MKKVVLVLVLFAILATGTVFAEHPSDQWGVGAQFGSGGNWDRNKYGTDLQNGAALSLKIPKVPVFWAARFESYWSSTFMGISGDYYILDKTIVKDVNFGWYLGVGGGFNLLVSGSGAKLGDWFWAGVRVPVGLSIRPIDLLEIYLQAVPNIGFAKTPDEFEAPYGGWGVDLGIRFWF